MLKNWWAFTLASGWFVAILIITASSLVWSVATGRAAGWFVAAIAVAIGVAGSLLDFRRRGTPPATSISESVRRAKSDLPSVSRIDPDRPLVGVGVDDRGSISSYVSAGLAAPGSISIVEVDARGRVLWAEEKLRADVARNQLRERGIEFIPQSKYSDALWRQVFGPIDGGD